MNARKILQQTGEQQKALGAFNFCTAEILRAIIEAAQQTGSPIIVATSEGEAGFLGMRQAVSLVQTWREQTGLEIILNLDHGKNLEKIKEAIEVGYDAIHFDGSQFEYAENLERTKEVVQYIKSKNKNMIVEGELGYLTGSSALHKEVLRINEKHLTDPDQAAEFVKETGIDSLAMVIGNVHGVYVNSPQRLYLERLEQIKRAVGKKAFLVLHGGSGIPTNDIQRAIALGVVKINVNTDMRLVWTGELKESLHQQPDCVAPYKLLQGSLEGVKKVVERKIKLFNSK